MCAARRIAPLWRPTAESGAPPRASLVASWLTALPRAAYAAVVAAVGVGGAPQWRSVLAAPCCAAAVAAPHAAEVFLVAYVVALARSSLADLHKPARAERRCDSDESDEDAAAIEEGAAAPRGSRATGRDAALAATQRKHAPPARWIRPSEFLGRAVVVVVVVLAVSFGHVVQVPQQQQQQRTVLRALTPWCAWWLTFHLQGVAAAADLRWRSVSWLSWSPALWSRMLLDPPYFLALARHNWKAVELVVAAWPLLTLSYAVAVAVRSRGAEAAGRLRHTTRGVARRRRTDHLSGGGTGAATTVRRRHAGRGSATQLAEGSGGDASQPATTQTAAGVRSQRTWLARALLAVVLGCLAPSSWCDGALMSPGLRVGGSVLIGTINLPFHCEPTHWDGGAGALRAEPVAPSSASSCPPSFAPATDRGADRDVGAADEEFVESHTRPPLNVLILFLESVGARDVAVGKWERVGEFLRAHEGDVYNFTRAISVATTTQVATASLFTGLPPEDARVALRDEPLLWTHARASGAATTYMYSTHEHTFEWLDRFQPPVAGGGVYRDAPAEHDLRAERGADIFWRLRDLEEKGADKMRGCGDDREGVKWFLNDLHGGRHREPFFGMYSFCVCHGHQTMLQHPEQWRRHKARREARERWAARDPELAADPVSQLRPGPPSWPGGPPVGVNDDGVVVDVEELELQEELWWQDYLMGDILEGLEARGVLDHTAIVVLGDHGGTPVVAPGTKPKQWKRCRRDECTPRCPCPEDAVRNRSVEVGRIARSTTAYLNIPLWMYIPHHYISDDERTALLGNTKEVVSLIDVPPTVYDLMGRRVRGRPHYSRRLMSAATRGQSLLHDLPAGGGRDVAWLNTGLFRAFRYEPFGLVREDHMLLFDDITTSFHLVRFQDYASYNFLPTDENLWPQLPVEAKLRWLSRALQSAYTRRIVWLRYVLTGAYSLDGLSMRQATLGW